MWEEQTECFACYKAISGYQSVYNVYIHIFLIKIYSDMFVIFGNLWIIQAALRFVWEDYMFVVFSLSLFAQLYVKTVITRLKLLIFHVGFQFQFDRRHTRKPQIRSLRSISNLQIINKARIEWLKHNITLLLYHCITVSLAKWAFCSKNMRKTSSFSLLTLWRKLSTLDFVAVCSSEN